MLKCTHIYDQTVSHNHGFADFIRGSICLFQYCNKYGYSFYIDKTAHPIFKYLKDYKYYSHEGVKQNPLVLKIDNIDPSKDHEILKNLFESNLDIDIFTNALYLKQDGSYTDFSNIWPALSDENKKFARTILQPNDYLNSQIDRIYKEAYQIDNFEYEVIHLRFPDIDLNVKTKNKVNEYDINTIINKIKNLLITNRNTNYILMCSSSQKARFIKKELSEYSNFKYWDNLKVHTGYLQNTRNQPIIETLIDFFIMSRSTRIYQFSAYGISGFSRLAGVIYDVDIKKL